MALENLILHEDNIEKLSKIQSQINKVTYLYRVTENF